MSDLNDLSRPVPTDTEPNVLDTLKAHIVRASTWTGWTATANKVAGLMSGVTAAVTGGRSLRLYRRNDANTADEEVVLLPAISVGGNAGTASAVQVGSSLETSLNAKAAASHTHGLATTTTDGFMSAAEKVKLNAFYLGANNMATGIGALGLITAGNNNAANGSYALGNNTTGSNNAANGYQSLYANTTGGFNVANGSYALGNNTTGSDNAANGYQSLYANTTGSFNVANGTHALVSNTTGSNNVANGGYAMYFNTFGTNNVANGSYALYYNTFGSNNSANGVNALYANTTGGFNVANGINALYSNTTGNSNAANGVNALYANTTGGFNVANGSYALYSNATGSFNIANGYKSLYNNTTGSGNTAINPLNSAGAYAPIFDPTTENNRFCMGSTAVTNAYIQVAWTVVSDVRDKTEFAANPLGLKFINKLQTWQYRYKETREATEGHGPVRYGFKAQDVLAAEMEIAGKAVVVDADDPEKLRFNDQAMIAALVNAVNELTAEFNEYKLTHP